MPKTIKELFDTEIGEEFFLKSYGRLNSSPYHFNKDGYLCNKDGSNSMIETIDILLGKFEIEKIGKPVLSKSECLWLKNVMTPFYEEIEYVSKLSCHRQGQEREYLNIHYKNGEDTAFLSFVKGSMYKDMELFQHYTLMRLQIYILPAYER